jgi:putative RNA 2'-phosphotransferase
MVKKADSRLLSYVLRHKPESIGLALDAQGWVAVDALLEALERAGYACDRERLRGIVETNDKQRFTFDAAGLNIRASQGHSVDVDLGYAPAEPPALLYHGTVAKFLDAIRREGLVPGSRRHVHLSIDRTTAHAVGARRGNPVILAVDAAAMRREGYVFFRADNGVWLTDAVPPRYLAKD